ncbi:GGDEF domain-containing protein [Amphritea balenae]|uniref:diguanylate cyclase n=1 Tax=Amphritea balenae TaxID=452629 RepID=A0A3P1SHX9_9GAMM|nr:sensor domain-containing diguanylate cyclase [Amphritea balenae]RRC96881.1 sensor domain-containing diguanylate cyclase [Amphritea balenae]GGK60887.1 hypothetical protein GCM10007941_08890 [Amphritea balenae]
MQSDFPQSEFLAICPDPVIAVNHEGIITTFNPAAERLLAYSAEGVLGQMSIFQLYPSEEEARAIMRLMLSEHGCIEGYETTVIASDGRAVPIRLSAALLEGQSKGSIGFFHDMTQQKRLEKSLKHLSITDDLSGLFNQRYFYEQLGKEMARARRYGNQLGLVCIDLDGFKRVNDLLGHLEGDKVVRLIGELLRNGLRDSDQAFRYGGDEFMVLLPDTSPEHAEVLADRLRKTFNAECLLSPEYSNETDVVVSMSMGLAASRGEEPVDRLIQRADMAMYAAKQSGGNCGMQFQGASE